MLKPPHACRRTTLISDWGGRTDGRPSLAVPGMGTSAQPSPADVRACSGAF